MQEFLDMPCLYPPIQEFVEGEFFAGELYVDEAKASFQQLGFKRLVNLALLFIKSKMLILSTKGSA